MIVKGPPLSPPPPQELRRKLPTVTELILEICGFIHSETVCNEPGET